MGEDRDREKFRGDVRLVGDLTRTGEEEQEDIEDGVVGKESFAVVERGGDMVTQEHCGYPDKGEVASTLEEQQSKECVVGIQLNHALLITHANNDGEAVGEHTHANSFGRNIKQRGCGWYNLLRGWQAKFGHKRAKTYKRVGGMVKSAKSSNKENSREGALSGKRRKGCVISKDEGLLGATRGAKSCVQWFRRGRRGLRRTKLSVLLLQKKGWRKPTQSGSKVSH
ncbi:hypothetical protein LIER_35160 [Lithospermum erythrorhizon]|uniref:Uncharacterized protein n=1 Tax=Lithospermum erythrorhizon TaxID=34254 RepID=A0AAV3NKT3_LITER